MEGDIENARPCNAGMRTNINPNVHVIMVV